MSLVLLADPVKGENSYGPYLLMNVFYEGDEWVFFSPNDPEVYDKLSKLRKGQTFEITKLAEQVGKKVVTRYEITVMAPEQQPVQPVNLVPQQNNGHDIYFNSMLSCILEALEIQKEVGGSVDIHRIAITLFIARTRVSGLSNMSAA